MIQRMAHAMSLQPAALVVLMSGGAEVEYQRLLRKMLENTVLDGPDSQTSVKQMPMLIFGVAKRGSPLLPARWPNDTMPQLLDRQLSAHVEIERKPFTAYNVVAVARGSDPRLNKTYVAYGAHYDHIGIVPVTAHDGRRAARDSIANGANDDGSGSVALLAIAREMMVYRPRRSALFVWHVGEENGLLGSKFFTAHSTVPIDSIVSQFNADMIGRNDSNTVALIGPRAAPNYQSWRLGIIVDSVNRALPTPLHIERKWDDPNDSDRLYERSDQYPYAKRGIPVILFTTGPHDDYHNVSDEASKIDYDKMARIAQLMVESGLAVANRSHRPTSEELLQSISSRQP
jgi:Zn-dependent M28 family amino/carboxypeptidase